MPRSAPDIDRAVPSSFPFSLAKLTHAKTAVDEGKIEAEGVLLQAGFRVIGELASELDIDRWWDSSSCNAGEGEGSKQSCCGVGQRLHGVLGLDRISSNASRGG